MYPLLVATRELHARGTAHMMGRAAGMQVKHRASVRVHGGRRSAAIPHIDHFRTICYAFETAVATISLGLGLTVDTSSHEP